MPQNTQITLLHVRRTGVRNLHSPRSLFMDSSFQLYQLLSTGCCASETSLSTKASSTQNTHQSPLSSAETPGDLLRKERFKCPTSTHAVGLAMVAHASHLARTRAPRKPHPTRRRSDIMRIKRAQFPSIAHLGLDRVIFSEPVRDARKMVMFTKNTHQRDELRFPLAPLPFSLDANQRSRPV